MSYVTGKRSSGSALSADKPEAIPASCARCQIAHRADTGSQTYLLLGAPNGSAQQALVNVLEEANTPYRAWEHILALPTLKERISGISASFLNMLPEATLADAKGAFFSGDLSDPAAILAAFIRAEPLSNLREKMQYGWVQDALEDDWLFSLFQPIIDASSGGIFAYEALIRARQPKTQEIIGAGPLIDAAIKLNIEHVFDQKARQVAIRNAAALGIPRMRLFINFMPNTIYDPEICLRTTMEAVQECGMKISDLVFEVVESERIPDMKRLLKILNYYRSHGAGAAVDDMGAGFTSMEYLTALRPDYVKLDRGLVVQAETKASARQSLDLIVEQARRLEIKVIAEGIETEGQMQMCRNAGVDYMQGFLFGMPANPPQVLRPLPHLLAA